MNAMATPHMAYFNHAGASLMSPTVIDTVVAHLQLESRIGGYAAAMQQQATLDQVYARAAQLLNGDTDEIALTDSHSRGWRDVLSCLHFSKGDRILVAHSEWGGNYAALAHMAQRSGASLEVIPATAKGEVCLDSLAHMLDERVRLVSLTWLPANGGLIQPAAKVGALTRAAGIPFFLDAAQAVGQLPVVGITCVAKQGLNRIFAARSQVDDGRVQGIVGGQDALEIVAHGDFTKRFLTLNTDVRL